MIGLMKPQNPAPKKEATKSTKIDMLSSSDDKSIIPKYFALQNYSPRHPQPANTAPYLLYEPESTKLEFYGEIGLRSPLSKFESEISDSDPKLVHIRCTDNNKYWVRQSSHSNHIVPTATKKEDDQSKWSCTLFEPIYDVHYDAYRFRHVRLGYELFRDKTDQLVAKEKGETDSEREDAYGVFTKVIDWNSLCVFPKHVTFKGFNGKYLRYEGKFLEFSGEKNHPSLLHEIFPQKDGNIHIKNCESRRFWVYDPTWIVATDRDGSRDDPDLSFQPVKLHDNVVSLRSLGNGHFCISLSADEKTDCLNATAASPSKKTQLQVSEAYIISSRTIDTIQYRLENARIYGERVWSMANGYAINKTKAPEEIKFTFSFEDKRDKKWTSIFANQFGATKHFNAGFPSIKDAEVIIGDHIGGPYTWGETDHKDKISMSCNSTITVPPMSKVKVNVVVKRGFCEVPFWYTQIKTTLEGRQMTEQYHDGVFTGVKSYQFQITTDQEALPV